MGGSFSVASRKCGPPGHLGDCGRVTGKPEVIPSLSRSGTLSVAWDARGQILVHKTLGQIGLEVTDISGRVREFFSVRNSCVY